MNQIVVAGVDFAGYNLNSRCLVDVCNGRDSGLGLLFDSKNLVHEKGIRQVSFKIIARIFLENGWCEGPESFAELDLSIQSILHSPIPWISEDASVSKSSRSQLGSSLKPTDDSAVRNMFGNQPAEICIVVLYRSQVIRFERCNIIAIFKTGTEVNGFHFAEDVVTFVVSNFQRRPCGNTIVGGSGLNEKAFEVT